MDTCKVCHREFFGNYTFRVVEIGDSGICSRCALLAVDAMDNVEMHATDLGNGWIGIPKVEWLSLLEEYKSAQLS